MASYLKKYGTATTILFPLIDAGTQDFESTPVTHSSGDTQISKDEGAFTNTTNAFAHEGNGIYSLTLTATEMQAATIVVTIIDSATKAWEDQAVIIDTYGNASAEHAFDLDVATQDVNVTQISGDSTAADNLELMFDGTGYAGGTTKLAVDAVAISGDTTAADNLELDYDGTGYAKTNSTIGTCTTNTDMITAATVNAQCDTALSDIGLDHLLAAAVVGADVTDNSIIAKLVSSSATADWDSFVNTTDSLQAIRDVEPHGTAMRGTDSAFLAASAPTNFSDLAITVTTGKVTVGTNDDKTGYSISGTKTTLDALNDVSTAQVNTEADNAIVTYGLDHLVSASVTGTDITDDSIIAKLVSSSATADWDDFANTTDSLQALRDTLALEATVAALNDLSAAEVNTEVDTALSDIGLDHLVSAAVTGTDVTDDSIIAYMVSKSATADWDSFNNTTDSLEAIRDRGDTSWSASGMDPQLLQDTTIATLASQTSFTLTDGSTDDDAYNGQAIIIQDSATTEQKAVGEVSDYTGSTKTVTLKADPGIFTMAVGDTVKILAMRGTDNALLSADISLSGGAVTVGTNNDKTGYSISGTKTTLDALNDVSTADVNAQCDTALTDYDAIVPADLPANFSDLSISVTTGRVDVASIEGSDATDQINAACDTAIETYGLDHLVSAAVIGTDVADNSIVARLVSSSATADWDDFVNTTDSLQAMRDTLALEATVAALNDVSTADIDARLAAIGLDHLVSASVTGTDITDDSIIAKLVSKSATADWDSFDNTTDSMEALMDDQTDKVARIDRIESAGSVNDPSATTTSFIGNAGLSATDDFYKGQVITFTSGDLSGLQRVVSAYNGTTKAVTLDATFPLPSAPANAVTFNVGGLADIVIALQAFSLDHLMATPLVGGEIGNQTAMAKLVGTSGVWSSFNPVTDSLEALSNKVALEATVGALNDLSTSDIDTRLAAIGLDHLVGASVTGTDVTDDSIIAKLVSKSATADWDDFVNTSDSLQAISDDKVTTAQVNAEVLDVMATDTLTELAQAQPSATPTHRDAIMALYMALRNKLDVTATTKEVHNDAGTVIFKKTLSDDGTTYSEAQAASGP